MVDTNDGAVRAYEIGKHSGQVAGAGANIKDAGTGSQDWKKGLAGRSVHVRGGDGGTVADRLRRVFVGMRGGVVGTVNLVLHHKHAF